MNGQRCLFEEPPRDIWNCEQLWRLAAEGYYWTPEGLRNGPYVKSDAPAQEQREPNRARPHRTQPSRKVVLA